MIMLSTCSIRSMSAALSAALCLHGAQAQPQAASPQDLDALHLTRANFYQVLEPLARKEGRLVLYNSAGNYDAVWKDGLIPRFEARYGMKVEYHDVSRDQANQQLLAMRRAGMSSPVDVYFAGGSNNFETLRDVVAPYRLDELLPNLVEVPAAYKSRPNGIDTQGRWPIVHRSQLVLGYDSATLAERDVPRDFASLLAWAQAHPRKFALTSPLKGGSGSAFLYSAAQELVTDPACRERLRDPNQSEAATTAWAEQARCLAPLWSYMERLVRAAELTNGNADTLNLVNNRQVLICTAWEDQSLTFVRAKLLPASYRVTSIAPALAAGGDGIVVAARAHSPAAALLFVDMAFGKEFQAWKLAQHGSRSPRPDVDVRPGDPAANYLVPPEQARNLSTPANFAAARALAKAFQETVLSRL